MKINFLLALLIVTSSCAIDPYKIRVPYRTSSNNKSVLENIKNEFIVETVAASPHGYTEDLSCRGIGNLKFSQSGNIFDFIKKSLEDELRYLKKLSTSGLPIKIYLSSIILDTWSNPSWLVSGKFYISNTEHEFNINYPFNKVHDAGDACSAAYVHLNSLLSDLFVDIYKKSKN